MKHATNDMETRLSIMNPAVAEAFSNYPQEIKERLLFLRQLILETAASTEGITHIEETLKWGEPSYLCKQGSTIRINQVSSGTDEYAMYFHCQTVLIETFRELYPDLFRFDGNRALVFTVNDKIPVEALTTCIGLALTYHRVKHLPMLGA